ncbi:MAG: hypothetical protein ACH37Z_19330, partial [Anaerolineae bacterium]
DLGEGGDDLLLGDPGRLLADAEHEAAPWGAGTRRAGEGDAAEGLRSGLEFKSWGGGCQGSDS